MRRVIGGKAYDTSTAKLVWDDDNGALESENWYEGYSLYLKKTGGCRR